MEDLKNVRNFEEFKNDSLNEKLFIKEFGHLNEEALWAAIKNLFSKIFGNIDKKLADAVSSFTQKLDRSKTWEESVKYFQETLNQESASVSESLKTISGPLGLRKLVGDNATVVFVQWLEMKNKYAIDACAPKVVFNKNPMFQFDKSVDFNKNILNAATAVILEVNKNSQNPYNEAELKDILNKSNTDINQVQKPADQQTPAPPATNTTPKAENSSYNFNGEKLFEIAASQPNPSGDDSKVIPTNVSPAATTPATTTATAPVTTGTTEQPLDKLKPAVQKYITDNYYGFSSNKIKEIKAPAKIGTEDAMLALAKGSKATTLHNNLAKMLRYIINIQDKQTLLKVRDAIAGDPNLKTTPNDLKNEMPL